MRSLLPVVSAIIALISPIIYARAILRGDAKPDRTTRLVLLLITMLTLASIIAQHNYVSLWLAAVSALQSVLIFALSIKHGFGGKSKSDIVCLVIAFLGIVMWQVTKQPIIALYFAIGADFTGMIPALLKTYRQPETEIWLYFGMDVVAGFLTLVASRWTLKDLLYPFYIMVINGLMAGVILTGQKKQKAKAA